MKSLLLRCFIIACRFLLWGVQADDCGKMGIRSNGAKDLQFSPAPPLRMRLPGLLTVKPSDRIAVMENEVLIAKFLSHYEEQMVKRKSFTLECATLDQIVAEVNAVWGVNIKIVPNGQPAPTKQRTITVTGVFLENVIRSIAVAFGDSAKLTADGNFALIAPK